jgi:hypothetical protein
MIKSSATAIGNHKRLLWSQNFSRLNGSPQIHRIASEVSEGAATGRSEKVCLFCPKRPRSFRNGHENFLWSGTRMKRPMRLSNGFNSRAKSRTVLGWVTECILQSPPGKLAIRAPHIVWINHSNTTTPQYVSADWAATFGPANHWQFVFTSYCCVECWPGPDVVAVQSRADHRCARQNELSDYLCSVKKTHPLFAGRQMPGGGRNRIASATCV